MTAAPSLEMNNDYHLTLEQAAACFILTPGTLSRHLKVAGLDRKYKIGQWRIPASDIDFIRERIAECLAEQNTLSASAMTGLTDPTTFSGLRPDASAKEVLASLTPTLPEPKKINSTSKTNNVEYLAIQKRRPI